MNLQTDPHAHLRAAFDAGCRIQAWHLNDGAKNSNNGRWDTLAPPEGREPEFGCAPHLYRVHPEDEAKALEVWDFRMPTDHLPPEYRFYVERLVSNTNPAGLVRDNELLRDEVRRLGALVAATALDSAEVAPGAFYAACQRACGELPEGWTINLCLENGSGTVELIDPKGTTEHIDVDADDRLAAEVNEAIDIARAAAGDPPCA